MDAVNTYREVLPETIIPIGDDGGGNQFCLGVRGKDVGKVYFHNHSIGWHADAEAYRERGEEVPVDIHYQTVYVIAPSFEQFILNMVKEGVARSKRGRESLLTAWSHCETLPGCRDERGQSWAGTHIPPPRPSEKTNERRPFLAKNTNDSRPG